MDFGFSEEQRQLTDTLQRFLRRDYGFEQRRAILASPAGWSRAAWSALAELGVLAINVPEAHGGLGYGPVETMLVMNAIGAGLVVEPYLASAVIATTLLAELADESIKDELLPQLASGEAIAALAHFEPESRFDAGRIAATASAGGDGYLLSGHKAVVEGAAASDFLLVSARTRDHIALFLLGRDTPGLSLRDYPTVDGRRAAEVRLANVYAPATVRLGQDAMPAIARALDVGLAALCAEAVGAMSALQDATVDYLKTRQQFGQPLARFQALQHRAAEMLLHLEQARSISYLATLRCTAEDERERRRALAAAKVVIGRACRFIGQNAVQLHGGMGMSDELAVSHWFKRLTAIELDMGDTDTHLQRFIAITGEG
ncbi:MAG TPA: acyl-CoA dehydrogenase [Rhodocyclaceae bacterium]|nr:acyl-CoA dehydrogenase [Rhodocyclaceae bacterium]